MLRKFYKPGTFLALAAVLAMLPIQTLAQQESPAPQGQEQQESQPLETLKVNVNVVNVFLNVKDRKGGLIASLDKGDFEISEDGKPQTIKYFSREADQPLTIGMLIDTSGSQMRVLPEEQEVGAQFLSDVLRPKDLAFLISFDVNVNLEQDLTSSGRDLRVALNKVRINSPGGGVLPGLGGGPVPTANPRGTLLYDAVFLAADEKLKSEVGRKAMIILTDGEDQGSQLTIKQAIEAAQKSDAICYVLLIADSGQYQGFGAGEMKTLATDTGGRVIEVGNNRKKLQEALQQISNELRTQYMIGYTPTNNKQDGSYRKIELKSKNKDYKVQARKGYYAPRAQ